MSKGWIYLVAALLLGAAGASAADVTGSWAGSYYGGPIYLMLKQDGARLSGSGGGTKRNNRYRLRTAKSRATASTLESARFNSTCS
jgi:hypothetical protein